MEETVPNLCPFSTFTAPFTPQDFQEQLKAISFKDMVIRGRELTGALITALINVYIKDSASVDAVSSLLRDICPLLYSSDDSICSKVTFPPVRPWVKKNQGASSALNPFLLSSQANELLQSSRQIQSKPEKERTLKDSLRLYQQISNHTDLPLVCSQYRQGERPSVTCTRFH